MDVHCLLPFNHAANPDFKDKKKCYWCSFSNSLQQNFSFFKFYNVLLIVISHIQLSTMKTHHPVILSKFPKWISQWPNCNAIFSFFFFKHFHLFKSTPTRDTKADRRQEVIMLYSFLQCRSTGMPCLGNSTWWEAAELPAPPHVVLEEPSRCLFLPPFCQV